MDNLREEIAALIDQLKKSDINGSAVERQTISHLNRLVASDETAFDQGLADLNSFGYPQLTGVRSCQSKLKN